jgi:hypothetical protein
MTRLPVALALAAVILMSCSVRPNPPLTARQTGGSDWYEEQIEEGFGHLDQLPSKWTMAPQ